MIHLAANVSARVCVAARRVAWLGALAFAGTVSHAGERGAFRDVDLMPAGMDVVAVLNAPGADGVSREVLGSAAGLLGDLGLVWETRRSWAELSKTLGYTEAEASDALLGGRIVVGWRGLAEGGLDPEGIPGALTAADTGWLLVAPVPEATARRLRDRLNAVPRRISAGHAVYSVDAGRTGMAVIRHGETWRMIVAPTSNADLLDACLTRLRDGEPDTTRSEEADQLLGSIRPGWSALVVAYPRAFGGAVAFSLRGSGDMWTVGFAGEANAKHGAPVGLLGEIGGDALLAMASAGDPLTGEASLRFGIELEQGDDDRDGRGPIRFDSGYAVVLGGDGAGSALTALVTARGRSDASFVQAADHAVATLLADAPGLPDHGGLFPGAVRTHTLRGRSDSVWPGDRTRVAWCLGPDADDRSGVVALSVGSEAGSSTAMARHGREAWSRAADVNEDDAISVGYARPSQLVAALGMAPDPVSMLARQFDRITWDIRQHDAVVRGSVTLRRSPTKAKLGAD